MNKSQAEKKVYEFHAIFRVDVNDVKQFQNPTETSPFDHFLDPQSMPVGRICNNFEKNRAFYDKSMKLGTWLVDNKTKK